LIILSRDFGLRSRYAAPKATVVIIKFFLFISNLLGIHHS
jgi:hypothetical protein